MLKKNLTKEIKKIVNKETDVEIDLVYKKLTKETFVDKYKNKPQKTPN